MIGLKSNTLHYVKQVHFVYFYFLGWVENLPKSNHVRRVKPLLTFFLQKNVCPPYHIIWGRFTNPFTL